MVTIALLIFETIEQGGLIYTDEYSIYGRLEEWGYGHEMVNYGRGEFARDDDGDGFCEVHVNTMEGFWSLLRSWLRLHRGISQEQFPWYLGFFEFGSFIPESVTSHRNATRVNNVHIGRSLGNAGF